MSSASSTLVVVRERLPHGAVASGLPADTKLQEASRLTSGRVSLPVDDPLAPLLPDGGLPAGSVVAVQSSTALLLALLAAATRQGNWAAVLGVPDLGVLAAAEAGVDVGRLALVPEAAEPGAVAAALLDGVELLALAEPEQLASGARRALTGRIRQRGAVLLPLGRWSGADIELHCQSAVWHGPEAGHGRLHSREVLVRATGRGAAARPRSTRLLLPGPGGPVAAAADDGHAATPIRAAS